MSLSEKTNLGIVTHTNQRQYEWVKLDDVREAVKELNRKIGIDLMQFSRGDKIISGEQILKEIFGEKLCE